MIVGRWSKPRRNPIVYALFKMLWCERDAPFGVPVVPLVNYSEGAIRFESVVRREQSIEIIQSFKSTVRTLPEY